MMVIYIIVAVLFILCVFAYWDMTHDLILTRRQKIKTALIIATVPTAAILISYLIRQTV